MCLAIPAKIVDIKGTNGTAEIGGVRRDVDLRMLDDVELGDFVIIHAGFAIQKLDTKDAEKTLAMLREIAEF